MVYSQQAVQNLLTLHQPTRIALLVRTKAPIYSCSPDEIVQTACDTLGIPVAEAVPTLLVVDKWNKLDVFVFDVFVFDVYHVNYDPETAHRMCVLPVVLVDYSRQATTIKLVPIILERTCQRITVPGL